MNSTDNTLNTDSADLQAYLTDLGDLVKTGATGYQTVNNLLNGGKTNTTPVNQQVQNSVSGVTAPATKSWLPWAIGGGVGLLVILFVALRK